MRRLTDILAAMVLCAATAGNAAAQTPGGERINVRAQTAQAGTAQQPLVSGGAVPERFDRTERRNPWNGGVNAAGIRLDTTNRSFAELFFTKENGGLADYSSSDDSWNAGARTRSFRHLKKVSFAGGFEYDYFDGRNMSGSMFTVPGYYPVDILEFTPGRKIRETYALEALVSAVLGERWTGGLRTVFKARNYAKRRDLRHKNTRLDFEFSPGVMYRADRFAVGAAYIVGIDTEKLEAEAIGAASDDLEAFFDRGLRYGFLDEWESNNLHLTTSGVSGFPVRETTQGAALQVQYGPLYVEAAHRFRQGETGERGSIWHRFETQRTDLRAVLSLGRYASRHFVRLGLEREALDNRENILTYETVNGVSNPHIHGSVPVFGRRSLSLTGEYEWMTGSTNLRLGVDYSQLNRESTLMYPLVKGQKIHYALCRAEVLRRFGFWELTLGADFRSGGFDERDAADDAPAEPGDYPVQLSACYDYENEYLTADRLGAVAGVRRLIGGFYVDLAARYEHGFGLRHVAQPNRVRATLRIGYNF